MHLEKVPYKGGDEHSSEVVTTENLTKRTQCGSKNVQMLNTEHSVQLENVINGDLTMAANPDLCLPYIDTE